MRRQDLQQPARPSLETGASVWLSAGLTLMMAITLCVVACHSDEASGVVGKAGTPDARAPISGVDRRPELSSGLDAWVLSTDQISADTTLALDGDSSAANRLVMYYSLVLDDAANERRWAQVAAENGDTFSQDLLGQILYEDGGEWNCRRGQFWLRRAMQSSSGPTAIAQASELDRMAKSLEKCVSKVNAGQ